jgi:phosphoglycerol transferase
VRYSYGSDKGRSREEWQRRVEAMAPAKMVDRLEEYGFSGVVVDRRGYADGGRSLLSGFAEAGRNPLVDEEGGGRAFVRLSPRAPARVPESAPRFGDGWYGRPQAEGFWAQGTEADWIVDNGGSAPRTVSLSFELTVAKPRKVSLLQDGRLLATYAPEPTASVRGLRVVLPPGESHLVLSTDRPPDLVEVGNRLRMATFAVKDLEMKEE